MKSTSVCLVAVAFMLAAVNANVVETMIGKLKRYDPKLSADQISNARAILTEC